MKKYTGLSLTISAPTWITVGPSEYWNAFGTNVCGVTLCSTDNVGVFSTGLTGKLALDWVPSRFGKWYAKAGFQYYNFLNDNLQLAQTATLVRHFLTTRPTKTTSSASAASASASEVPAWRRMSRSCSHNLPNRIRDVRLQRTFVI